MNNDIYRRKMNEHQEKLAEEREFWNKKKASIQEGFMKELNEDSGSAAQTTSATKAPEKTAAPAPSAQGSDDDAVLVEADASGATAVSGGGGGGGKKKKGKGKK